MRKTVGPIVVLDTRTRPCPSPGPLGNQATYLFFPVFISFVLALIAYLSAPIIGGLSVATVHAQNGTVWLGTWGWCASGTDVNGTAVGTCSTHRAFGGSETGVVAQLPVGLAPVADVSEHVPTSFIVANTVFHLFCCITLWITTCWTLAASGQWRARQVNAWDWTRWAFAGTFWSSIFLLIAWAMDISFVSRMKSASITTTRLYGGESSSVVPGAAIWMMMVAWLLQAATFTARTLYFKYKPRPQWTLKGGSDFHQPNGLPAQPNSAALPPPDEQLPTWESLNLTPRAPVDEKREPEYAYARDGAPVAPGFAV